MQSIDSLIISLYNFYNIFKSKEGATMQEPIYSRRYPKDGEGGRAKEASGKEKWDFLRGPLRRDMIFGKVVEVTNRSHSDVDIFEGNETMLVKIYFDFPSSICELDGMLSMA